MSAQQTETIAIDDMHCEHCVDVVREALDGLEGVDVTSVEIGEATLAYDGSTATRDAIVQAVEEAGYAVSE
jgi:copper chaperone CopZ